MLDLKLSDISLVRWIEYTNAVQPMDKEAADISGFTTYRKPVLLSSLMVRRAYFTLAFFEGIEFSEATDKYMVDDVVNWYNDTFMHLFDDVECDLTGWYLPAPDLTPTNGITFGEFIDAKMMTQASAERNKWELLQYIAAIFLRKQGEAYNPEHIEESSERFALMGEMSMPVMMQVSNFFEALNTYANDHFTVFQDSGEDDDSANMKQHMQRWGWINFLKSIAKTKVFDLPGTGLNSIECVRRANACEVLTWASEEKDYNISSMRDMEDRMRK